MGTYTYNKHVIKHLIKHRFCPDCGCSPYSEGIAPSGDEMVAINPPQSPFFKGGRPSKNWHVISNSGEVTVNPAV